MNFGQTLIATALIGLLSAPSYADYQPFVERHHLAPASSVGRDYLGCSSDTAQTEWLAPTNEREAVLQIVRDLLSFSGLAASELRQVAQFISAYFTERMINQPQSVRLIAKQDPEDGRGYLSFEIPIAVGSSMELAELDFDLSMKVASLLSSGTEKLVVTIVRA